MSPSKAACAHLVALLLSTLFLLSLLLSNLGRGGADRQPAPRHQSQTQKMVNKWFDLKFKAS